MGSKKTDKSDEESGESPLVDEKARVAETSEEDPREDNGDDSDE